MSREAFEAYAVWDDDEGMLYETIADTPQQAVHDMNCCLDLNMRFNRMIAGKVRVFRVRIEPLEDVSGELVPPQE